jgi:hypothetical protein
MKYFIALILAFSTFCGFNSLAASEAAKHVTYTWSGNEEDLYLNINLSKDLAFEYEFTTTTTKNGKGQGCEVVCKPVQEGVIFSEKGYELQEIQFTVLVNNIENPNKVPYTTITKSSYKGVNEDGNLVSTTLEYKSQGVLNNPAVDLSEDPVFFIVNDNLREGVVSFRNSFPYSQIR